jgi:hypothetical protein
MGTELQPGFTRFNRAVQAMSQALASLPPNDLVSVASFSTDLTWWIEGQTVENARKVKLPPAGIRPQGATNLEPVLDAVTMRWVTLSRLEVIVASDGDAPFQDASGLINRLRARQAQVSMLATADPSRSQMPRIVRLTGGILQTELNPVNWADAAKKLARAVVPDRVEQVPVTVSFTDKLASLPPRQMNLWNRTWSRTGATTQASTGSDAEQIPMAATWHFGSGAVAAAAFPANAAEIDALVKIVEQQPRDPRFNVTHSSSSSLGITVNAADQGKPLNDQTVSVALSDLGSVTARAIAQEIPQTAPGKYEIQLPAPRTTSLATVRVGETVIDRFAVAGRYAPEFNAIGNNRAAMRDLASRTGGAVIQPSQNTRIDFAWPKRKVSLTPWLAIAGAIFVALGLAAWKTAL